MKKPLETFIDPSYRRTSAGHHKIDGVQFHSYSTGVLQYANISEDGQIMVRCVNTQRNGAPRYSVDVVGRETIKSPSGKPKRFNSEAAACSAGVQLWRQYAKSQANKQSA
jgi:hypothetical protein